MDTTAPNLPKRRLHLRKSKNVLAEILKVDRKVLLQISKNSDAHYKVFPIFKDGKSRMVEEPDEVLKPIQHILKCIFGDIDLPDYLNSGRKKRSYVDNAKVHVANTRLTKMDISKFYPSCKREFVYRFFLEKLGTSKDIAEILTNLTTYKGHLPTGSPTSQILAYLINRDLFDNIAAKAQAKNMDFSLYVDDLCFSGNGEDVNAKLSVFVRQELKKNRLSLKRKKIISYGPHKEKLITGCLIKTNGTIVAPDKLKKKIFAPLKSVGGEVSKLKKKTLSSTVGRVQAAKQIEGKDIFSSLHNNLLAKARSL